MMEFIFADTIGASWAGKRNTKLETIIRQCEKKKILEYAERLGLYLDVLGIDHNSNIAKSKLKNTTRKEYKILWDEEFGPLELCTELWEDIVQFAFEKEDSEIT